jgi:hypothetical protein
MHTGPERMPGRTNPTRGGTRAHEGPGPRRAPTAGLVAARAAKQRGCRYPGFVEVKFKR